jgi:hypothetical protein
MKVWDLGRGQDPQGQGDARTLQPGAQARGAIAVTSDSCSVVTLAAGTLQVWDLE